MSFKRLDPCPMFDGTAERAIKRYESALWAKREGVMRFGDVPGDNASPESKDRIIHATLHIGPGVILVSDTMPGTPAAKGATSR
ncbi:hypothetical protein [Sorangium sp. So ce426]|uniref:hypothetical protein n=1 Tax=Sorangium sp. So ce426 TaxID=3133312 RepID=UPI003F5AE3B2